MTKKDDNEIRVFTDGSSRGNPGPGGYGAILLYGNHKKELSKGYRLTTNNRMEIMGVIAALNTITKKNIPVTVYSDSQYVVNAVEKGWLKKWMQSDFKGGKKNKDLWTLFYKVSGPFRLTFIWVKGHGENVYNNRCDQLATEAADSKDLDIDTGYEIENAGGN